MEVNQKILKTIAKLRSENKFLSIMPGLIHNLNTPLMNISGRIELLQFKMPELSGLDKMSSNLDKINEMLEDLTYFVNKSQTKEEQEIDLTELIYKFDSILNYYTPYKHLINSDIDVIEESTVNTKPYYLINALYEIYLNNIEVFDMDKDDDAEIKTVLEKQNNHYLLKIHNNGTKIKDDIFEKLYEPFITDKPGHDGLGLYLAKNSLDKISCTMTIENIEKSVTYLIKIPF